MVSQTGFRASPTTLGLGLLLMGTLVRPAAATTYNVSNVAELEAAVSAVNAGAGGDLIVMAPGSYSITGRLTISKDVTINGDALAPTAIDGSGLFSIFRVNAANISIQNLTLRNGLTAISYEGSGVFSGTGLTITGNDTGFYPGDSGGTTFFVNSTVTNNVGHGIEISCAELHLTNVTVSDNGMGVYFGFPCGELMEFTNSLIVRNTLDCGGGGSFAPVGDASFDSDGSCVAFGFGPGLTTVSLAALALDSNLAANGGPTLTRAITAASAAVNAGNDAECPAADQRGFLRSDGACDIGAYEFGATSGGNNTPAGSNVSVSPAPGVTVTFSQVNTAGNTAATTGGPPPPTGFQVDGVVYDISTTAAYTGPVTVCLPYSPTTNPNPRLYHYEDVPPPTWLDRTTSVDTVNHVVCGTAPSLSPFAVLMPVAGEDYFSVAPCRVVDTRGTGAPIGGPVLQGQQSRVFAMAGHCGIPATAKALSINATVTQPSAVGNVRLFPAGVPVPTTSSLNYAAAQTRGNNAIIKLSASGEMAAFVGQPAGTTVHLIIDVSGYFE